MGCVRVGLVLSCLFISACLALSGKTTDDEEEKTDTVARGRDQETEGRKDNGEEHGTDEGRGDELAARTRTRLGLCSSPLSFRPSVRLQAKQGWQGLRRASVFIGVRVAGSSAGI